MNKKIVHIVSNEKFIKPFIELINDNFDSSKHLFLNISNHQRDKFPLPESNNVIEFDIDLNRTKYFFSLWGKVTDILKEADKVIVHGAFTGNFNRYLAFNSEILSKSYWVMWGADLYQPIISPARTYKQKILSTIDYKVRKNFAGYISYLPGDFKIAKKLYDAQGEYYECIMYPSNLYCELNLPERSKKTTTLLIGNSADTSNNHEEVLTKLSRLEDQSFNIICPLSYGDAVNSKKIQLLGSSIFGSRFYALVDFMAFDDYLNVLAEVDIAIFAHKRQQAMGNTITLLGLGKTVYMRSDVTPFDLFKELDIKVHDIDNLNIELLDELTLNKNKKNVESYFSKSNLIKQLQRIFEA